MLDLLLTCLARGLTGVTARSLDESVFVGPKVYYANHSSHLDLVTIRATLPGWLRRQAVPVVALDYWGTGRVRRYIAERVFRAIFVDRHHHRRLPETLDTMAAALDGGHSLILFPEGTRSVDGSLATFKSGLYRLATRRSQTEFVPVWLENLNRILPKGEVLPVPFVSSITYGRAFCLDPAESREAFLRRARDRLEELREERP